MTEVHLTGQLICKDDDEAAIVRKFLPLHIALTRAESGCLLFEVTQLGTSLVWNVEERFSDEAAFRLHQERVSASDWGLKTAGITREYSIRGLAPEAR